MIEYIKSRENSLVKYVYKLKDNSFSKKERKFVIEGDHLCEMAGKNLDYILTSKEMDLKKYPKQYIVTKEILEKLSQGKSIARMIGVCNYVEEQDSEDNLVLFLDDVQDPGNVGTIFRTALAFGFKTIYMTSKTAFKYNSKVIQASQGSIFELNLKSGDINILKNLKKNNYELIATALNDKTIDLREFCFNKNNKYVIILGNEGQGISKDILELSTKSVKININGIESLNVAIAGGIIMNKAFNEGE